jgi:FkbM family methyltransferase
VEPPEPHPHTGIGLGLNPNYSQPRLNLSIVGFTLMGEEEENYIRWLTSKSQGCIDPESIELLRRWPEDCRGRFTLTVTLSKFDAELLVPCSQLPEAWANIIHVFCLNDYGLGELISLPKGGVVIDAGAYLGFFSILAGRHGAGLVIALEPNPLVREYLYSNLIRNGLTGRARVDPRALSDEDDRIVHLYIPEYWGNSSLAKSYVELMGYDAARRIPVRSVTLKTLISEHRVRRVDLLKLDIEGFEVRVLRSGAEQGVLSPSIIGQLVVEIHEPLSDNISAVVEILEGRGYKISVRRFDGSWRQAMVYAVSKK